MSKSFLCCHPSMMIVIHGTRPLHSLIFHTHPLVKLRLRVLAPVFLRHLRARPSLLAYRGRKISHCQHPLMLSASRRNLIPRIAARVHFRHLHPTWHFPYHHRQLRFQCIPRHPHSPYHRVPLYFPHLRLNLRSLRHLL